MDTTEKRKLFQKIKKKSKEKPSLSKPFSPQKKIQEQDKNGGLSPKNANIFVAKSKPLKADTLNEKTEKTSVSKMSRNSSKVIN